MLAVMDLIYANEELMYAKVFGWVYRAALSPQARFPVALAFYLVLI